MRRIYWDDIIRWRPSRYPLVLLRLRRVMVLFAWYDLWVGVFIGEDAVYVCPVPMLAVRIERK